MVSRYSLSLFVLMLLIGCRPATQPPTDAGQTQPAPDPVIESTSNPVATIPSEALEIRNAQYQLGATDALQIVQLTDGSFEQGTSGSDDFISISVTDFAAVGDLNADGTDELAALISENYGGTGVFVFLAVYSNMDGTLTFQTSTMADDRPQLNALSIENNEIFVDAVIHGFEDPMCCPTLKTTRHYRWVDNQLDMTDYTTFTPDGRPRTIMIESPTNGMEVFTSVPIAGNVAIAPFENNLAYRIFDISGIELAAGPIAVSAPDLGAPGTFDAIIPLGNILSGAIIRIEVQDLSAADGSLLAMDSVELVVK
ncbi:MAG TPA: Gmad2 immunoglobulin-like domain-containing protein [Anaerolineales bacterium]|nr:Gmad2 immunoglobulin-like domain-containing protein [Anaerolineales bacterium]